MTRAIALCLLAAGLLSACNEEEAPPAAATFQRPNRVAFVCVENGSPVSLGKCGEPAQPPMTRSQFALVTQSTRGELASVDLANRTVLDSRRDIPGFTFVPVGETPIAIAVPQRHPDFTFVANYGSRDIRVLRTELLVAPLTEDPTLAVFRIQTDAGAIAPTDMRLSPNEDALIVVAPDTGAVFWLPLHFDGRDVPLQGCEGGDPTCAPGDVQDKVVIPLAGSAALAIANPPPDTTPSQYAELCPMAPAPLPDAGMAEGDAAVPSDAGLDAGVAEGDAAVDAGAPPPSRGELEQGPVPTLPADIGTKTPRPIALAIDDRCEPDVACTKRILVADEALPLIHALDLDVLSDDEAANPAQDALLPPLQPGVPTRAVVATPIVPATREGGATKYVYAIDATDGSVLVMENERLLEVGADGTRRADRIDFSYPPTLPAPAVGAIEVISPLYSFEEPWLADCDERNEMRDPAILSGVFLAAALSDGTVRIVDIHDMELRKPDPAATPCRTCMESRLPLLVRHQPRLDVREPLQPEGALEFVVDGVAFGVRDNGSSPTPLAPALACIACDADLTAVKPDRAAEMGTNMGTAGGGGTMDCSGSQEGLLCAPPDPWSGANDLWSAIFEGTIPGTIGGDGRFVDNGEGTAPEFTLEVNPCLAGVLGNEDIGAALPGCAGAPFGDAASTALRGDQLVIGTRPLSRERLDALGKDDATIRRCEALAIALASSEPPPLSVEIRRAYANRLVLRNALVTPFVLPEPASSQSISTFRDLMACMPNTPIAYSIRSLGSFTVRGAQSGFLHRVYANSAQRCVIDPEADPQLQGRAAFDCPFRNREVQFEFASPEMNQTLEPGIELRAQAVSRAVKLAVATDANGVVPVQLVWNPVDEQMYMVDISALGLVPMQLNPLPPRPLYTFN